MGNDMATGEAPAGRDTPMDTGSSLHYHLKTSYKEPFPEGSETAVFATGCFWGTEKGFWRMPGVISTAVGYINGKTKNPKYEEVCSGRTGHTEACLVVYDPKKISYSDLLRLFWQSHDPCSGMGQGNDRGTQYRSGIYPTSDTQKLLAEASLKAYEAALGGVKITTEVVGPPSPTFFYAEEYHQQYLAKPGSRQYCSAAPRGVELPEFSSWVPESLKENAAANPKFPEAFWKKFGPKPHCQLNVPNEQYPHPNKL